MPLDKLSPREQEVVFECLTVSVNGPFFPDEEFSTLFGLTRGEVREVVERWPVDDQSDEKAVLAINNVINNLLGYPHGQGEAWSDYICVSRDEVKAIFLKWRKPPADGYFDAMR